MIHPMEEALTELRVSGSVLLCESYAAPWAVRIDDAARLRAALSLPAEAAVIPFHLARHGGFELRIDGHEPIAVSAGEVAICFCGEGHVMSRGQGAALRSSADILAGSTARSDMPAATDPAERSDLLCGVFMVRDAAMNPLFAALPPSIRLPVAADPRASIARVAALLEQEVVAGRGQGFVACRLLEIFFAAAVEAIAERDGATRPGWFRALADPRLAPAITALHADPSRAWSVDLLASTAALSPSRFAARFRAAMGESAMAYVARIRMARACRMLRTNNGTLAEVAAGVGYGDPAAFARAFRAMVGTSSGRWRRDAKVSDGNG